MNPSLLELLYKALNEQHGIVVQTTDPEKLRQKLYQARTQADDPDLTALSFRPSPTDPLSQLWIVKNAE